MHKKTFIKQYASILVENKHTRKHLEEKYQHIDGS